MRFWKWMSSGHHGGSGGHRGHGGQHGWARRDGRAEEMRRCLNCGVLGVAGARFCQVCGVSFVRAACERCKAAVEVGARFCGQCGAPVV
jgi:hypothetical protein